MGLVRKLGLKIVDGRADRQNEVWAGKPINMAAKLARLSRGGIILVSDRFHEQLTGERALMSCGCVGGEPGHQSTSSLDGSEFRRRRSVRLQESLLVKK